MLAARFWIAIAGILLLSAMARAEKGADLKPVLAKPGKVVLEEEILYSKDG